MGLRETIQKAQADALKNKQADVLSTLRLLWSAIRTEEINERKELDDTGIQGVVARQVKQLRDARNDFEKGSRVDLVQKTDQEIELLSHYLPKQLSDAELKDIVVRIVAQAKSEGVQDVPTIMGRVMKEVKGIADGARVRIVVTQLVADS